MPDQEEAMTLRRAQDPITEVTTLRQCTSTTKINMAAVMCCCGPST